MSDNAKTDQVYVTPGDGCKVRHPITGKPIPAEGGWHPKGPELTRRLRDGDLQEAKPSTKKTKVPAKHSPQEQE